MLPDDGAPVTAAPTPPPSPKGPTGAAIAAAARGAARAMRRPTPLQRALVAPATTVAVLAMVFAVAAGLAWASMPAGPLSGNDSVTYLAVARNIAAGQGVTSPFGHELTGLSPSEGASRLGATPLTAWPPLYPLALASLRPAGLSVETTSRLLNVIAAGASAVLTALLARRMGASGVAAALAPGLLVVNLTAVLSFAAVSSEALYLPLSLLALLALSRGAGTFAGEPGRALDLGVFVVAASAAALTRHAGAAVIITGVIVLSAGRGSGRSARLALGLGAAAAALPLAAWLWARRQPGWRSPPAFASRLADLPDAARAFATWLVPDRDLPALSVTGLVTGLVVATVAAAVAVAAPREHHPAPVTGTDPTRRAPWHPAVRTGTARRAALAVVLVHAVVYLVLVGVSAMLVDHGIPFDARLALPLLPPTLALLAAGADALVNAPRPRPARLGAAVAVLMPALALVAINARASHEHIWARPPAGVWTAPPGYPTMRTVAELPDRTLAFTNQPSAVFALSGRPVLALPVVRSPMTGVANPDAGRDIDQLVTLLAQDRAVVVMEKPTAWLHARSGEPLVGEEELRRRVPLEVVAEDERFVVLS
jgi:hypothetical protein